LDIKLDYKKLEDLKRRLTYKKIPGKKKSVEKEKACIK